jgi:antitoxin (DNA-binding transcriptional repressor) of toxin-antitoxin stability system
MLGQGAYSDLMTTVNVGQAKTELSRLIALALAGEDVEIARDGVPVVRLVALERTNPGSRFLAASGSLAGKIRIGDDFEFTEAEVDEMLDP